MDLFGKKGWIALSAVSVCLFGTIIWQFASGGRSLIRTEFRPVNDQMQRLIAQNAEQTQAPSKTEAERKSPPSSTAVPPSATELSAPSTTIPTGNPSDSFSSVKSSTVPASKPSATSKTMPAAPGKSSGHQLDLNTATLEELDQLPGIGASKAKAIIDYRNQKGRFSRIEELMEVKGIGEKMLEKLKPHIYVPGS
ncbi:helix-hairpin-helix domain-containing protein [Paenibacillus sp. GCM10027628]|uniref:helix-hairpin-helix domain-containing protein n=1 Tax=Paenibacillus sp. GCM10027628 TaxID=3273413 RepID=UPI00362BC50C